MNMEASAFHENASTRVAETFIELAGSIAAGAETIEIFTELSRKCVWLLPAAAAGILLRDVAGDLQVVGSSSPSAHLLDLFQVQNEEGPCLECLRHGQRILVDDVSTEGEWPRFTAMMLANGFTSVYALPLRSRRITIGALNLFTQEPLDESRITVAQALADAATLSLLQVDLRTESNLVVERIHRAVQSRNVLDQARGMIARRFAVDSDQALQKLMVVAHSTGIPLTDVATAVVTRDPHSPVAPMLSLEN